MSTLPPATSPASDEQMIRTFTFITIGFCGGLVIVLGLSVLVVVPGSTVRVPGLLLGAVLGLVSWFGSLWVTRRAPAGPGRTRSARAGGPATTLAFRGIAVAETPALVGLVVAIADGADVGALVVAVPIAIVAIVVNASGPGAMRRHLDLVRA